MIFAKMNLRFTYQPNQLSDAIRRTTYGYRYRPSGHAIWPITWRILR